MKKSYFLHTAVLLIALLWGATPGWADTYTKITTLDELTDGKYVIAYGTTCAMNNTNAGKYFNPTDIKPVNGSILDPDASIVWEIKTTETGKTINNGTTYVYCAGSKNVPIRTFSEGDNGFYWNFTAKGGGVFAVQSVKSTTLYLKYNNQDPRFTTYSSGQQDLTLYKLQETGKNNPELIFTGITGDVTKELSEGSYSSVATTASDAPIVYSSSNQEVATIDNGTVTLHAKGTTVIKAEVAETETFNAASIQYTLTVIDPASMTTFVKVTNGSITDGQYIIVYQDGNDATSVVAMNNTNEGSYFECSNINLSEGKIITDNEAIIWDIAQNENGTYTISNNGLFVNYPSDGTKINLSETMTAGKSTWNITSKSSNTFQIANSGTSSRLLRYKDTNRFACYSNTGSEANPTLYRVDNGKSDATISFNDIEGTTCEKMLTDGSYNSAATTTSDAPIVYSSSNQEVATIDQKGVVTLHAGGTTVIKAEVAETDNYSAAVATYTLMVTDPALIKAFEKVTTSSITTGQYLIVYQASETATSGSVMNAVVGDNKFLQASDIKITDNQISTDDTSIIWDITLNENGTYTISNNGQFVGYSGSSTTTKLYNSSDEGQSTWNISKNSDNTVKISNSTTSDRLLRYNTSVPRFASYATTGSEKDPTLYRLIDGKSDVTVTFTEVSGDKSLFFEEGLTYNSAATADPERPITYSSSNQEVATIDATGMVTLVGPGTTVIKATTEADDTYREGVAQYTLTVKAASVMLPYSTDFKSGLGDWLTYAIKGTTMWESTSYGAQANGYNKGDGETYLISPAVSASNIVFSFASEVAFNGPAAQLFYSDNFNPNTMQPSEATWIEITDMATWASSQETTPSGDIELNNLSAPVRFAFKYTCSESDGAARWTITNLSIQETAQKVVVTFNEVSGDKTLFFEEGLTYNSAATANPERPITYSSENQEVATIDAETGEVTLVGPGTTVIKATTEADESYEAASAQYTLTVKASSVTLPYSTDFKSGLGDWISITTTGTAQWSSSQYGAQINAAGKGATEAYLISPKIEDGNILLTFVNQKGFSGNDLQLLYSTDYNPNTMQPTEATWNDITDRASWGTSGAGWGTAVESGEIEFFDLTEPIRFAFKYLVPANEDAAGWQITDLAIQTAHKKIKLAFNNISNEKTLVFTEGFTYNSAATATPERPITYSSENQEVATIDAETGEVTLVGPGTTVISAATEGDEVYAAGLAQYTLTVLEASATLPYTIDFKSGFENWLTIATQGTTQWNSTQYGAQINGHGKGESEVYLISPEVTAENILLTFTTQTRFAGNNLQLLYSTDYNPNTMQPTEATWNDITDMASWGALGSDEWSSAVESGNVELYSLTSPIRFAFKYTCSNSEAAAWQVTDLSIQETTPKVVVTFDEVNGDKTLFFEEGFTYNSAATATPERPITYSSENREVATIDATGTVTLVGPGTTVIKATTEADDTYEAASAQYTLTVKASSVTLPYSTDFKSDLGDWLTYVTYGTTEWESTQFGAQANGYNKGDGETYLISPAVSASDIVFSFASEVAFNGPAAQLFYSDNFNPNTMQPAEATWNEITDMATWASSQETTPSGDIELENLTAPIRFAFKYTCSESDGAARWTITDLSIKEGIASGIATTEANGMKVINGKGEITIVTDAPASVAIYTLTGAQVRQIELVEGNNVVTLPAGIYVVNRQKVVVF